jgi:hypothetical protein
VIDSADNSYIDLDIVVSQPFPDFTNVHFQIVLSKEDVGEIIESLRLNAEVV